MSLAAVTILAHSNGTVTLISRWTAAERHYIEVVCGLKPNGASHRHAGVTSLLAPGHPSYTMTLGDFYKYLAPRD
jgi:hypothetical protein